MHQTLTNPPGGTPGVPTAARNQRRVLSVEETRDAVRREHARVRGGRDGEFAVVLFRVRAAGPKGRSLLSSKRLAAVLLRADGQASSAVGWFDRRHLCVVIPGVSAAAAGVAAARVCDAMGRGGHHRPRAVACGYPARAGGRIDRVAVV